jgi:sulfite reductase (NADPH) hemoprotein beta-component
MTAQVLTANRLADGEVVFLGGGRWVEHITAADLFIGDASAAALAQAEAQPTVVVAPYLIDVTPVDGVPSPSPTASACARRPHHPPRPRQTGRGRPRSSGDRGRAGAARSTGRVALIKRK